MDLDELEQALRQRRAAQKRERLMLVGIVAVLIGITLLVVWRMT